MGKPKHCPKCGYFYVLVAGEKKHVCGTSKFVPLVGKPSAIRMGKHRKKAGHST